MSAEASRMVGPTDWGNEATRATLAGMGFVIGAASHCEEQMGFIFQVLCKGTDATLAAFSSLTTPAAKIDLVERAFEFIIDMTEDQPRRGMAGEMLGYVRRFKQDLHYRNKVAHGRVEMGQWVRGGAAARFDAVVRPAPLSMKDNSTWLTPKWTYGPDQLEAIGRLYLQWGALFHHMHFSLHPFFGAKMAWSDRPADPEALAF